jgi:16S rRNA (guanine1207-N2)-methyltransferase
LAGTRDYHAWQQDSVRIGARTFRVATKPGVFAHGGVDESTLLLAEQARIAHGDTVVQLNCGNGLFGAVASAAGAATVLLADRNVLSFEAASRTLIANEIGTGSALLSHGRAGLPEGIRANTVAVRIPHDRMSQTQLLMDAFLLLDTGGICYLAGAVNEGVKPATRMMEELFGNAVSLAQRAGHRVVRAIKRSRDVPDVEPFRHPLLLPDAFHRVEATLRGQPVSLFTRPGVFSWEHVDEATEIMAATMEIRDGATVLDLGCGAGALGVAAGLSGSGALCMVDADSEAVRCADMTAKTAGLHSFRAIASDIASAVRSERFDMVISNPPFHVGKATDLQVPAQFIEDAWHVLNDGGLLQLVANRTLPYEPLIDARFGNMTTRHDGARFKVLTAEKRTP